MIVRWSGDIPVRRKPLPIGLTALSTGTRSLPSNIRRTLPAGPGAMCRIRVPTCHDAVMSKTSPADLAVTFRSVARRLDEALDGETPTAGSPLHMQLEKAAKLIGTTPDAASIAAAIEHTPADQWDEATLDGLRAVALDLGHELRRIAAEHADRDG